MSDVEIAAIAVAIGILTAVAVRLAWLTMTQSRQPEALIRNRDGSFQMDCMVCGAHAEVRPTELAPLSSAEKALAVRERPAALGKDLVEFVCPQCDASHCFSAHRDSMLLVGVNLYEGQQFQASCKECRKPLAVPQWQVGQFDGYVDKAPGDLRNLGLKCPFCAAICCVECCARTTRNRTADKTLLCPRCFRGPVDRFYHHTRAERGEPGAPPTD